MECHGPFWPGGGYAHDVQVQLIIDLNLTFFYLQLFVKWS